MNSLLMHPGTGVEYLLFFTLMFWDSFLQRLILLITWYLDMSCFFWFSICCSVGFTSVTQLACSFYNALNMVYWLSYKLSLIYFSQRYRNMFICPFKIFVWSKSPFLFYLCSFANSLVTEWAFREPPGVQKNLKTDGPWKWSFLCLCRNAAASSTTAPQYL